MVRINIDFEAGNAFNTLGMVKYYGDQIEMPKDRQAEIRAEMKSGDYTHLVRTFNEAFDGLVELYSEREEHGDFFEDEY